MAVKLHYFDKSLLSDERIEAVSNQMGLGYKDAKHFLIDILDDEYAPLQDDLEAEPAWWEVL